MALLLLAGCSGAEDGEAVAPAPKQAEAAPESGNIIACALGGAAAFRRDCKVDEAEVEGRIIFIVRHPDGGFRRFELLTDGRGLQAADGADEAVTRVADGRLDVSVGPDRYQFPATIRSHDRAE